MSAHATPITLLSAKDINHLQPSMSASWAQRQYAAVKAAFASRVVCVTHLASFWSLPESHIIEQLGARFSL